MLIWEEVTGATGYNIYRSDSLNGTYALVSDSFEPYKSIKNVMCYSDTGLTPNKTYYYKIKATTEALESEYSNTLSAAPQYRFTYDISRLPLISRSGHTK